MINLMGPEEVSVFWRFAPKIGFRIGFGAALAFAIIPATARAQVNIDQGKTAADIFQNDCATCHKSARGLADGKNSLMLSSFLREHYTASRDQASALAAYVLGAGGGAPQKPAQNPVQEHATATFDEPKPAEPKSAEPKNAGPKGAEPKTAARPEQETKPADSAGKPAARPVTASRGRKPEPGGTTPPQLAAPILAAPANATPSAAEAPSQAPSQASGQESGVTKSASAPAESQPGDNAPVPRDNIPD
jgi:hypothetical protein